MDLLTVEKKLIEIANWPENWNGYGCNPPTRGSIVRAYVWLRDIALPVCDGRIDTMTSGCWGEVFLEWWKGMKKLSIAIDEQTIDGLCFNMSLPQGHPWEFMDVLCTKREQFAAAWNWLMDAEQMVVLDPEV